LVSRPDGVFWDGNHVSRAGEDTDWEFNVAHLVLWSVSEAISIDVSLNATIVESLELLFRKRN
jgi:hypothetical protein